MELEIEEYEYERECKTMIIEFDALEIEIPNELIEKRQKIYSFGSLEENINDMLKISNVYYEYFKQNQKNIEKDLLQKELIKYLQDEVDIYK